MFFEFDEFVVVLIIVRRKVMLDKELYRSAKLVEVAHGDMIQVVKMEMLPKAVGYGFLDDIWDGDGDSIIARAEQHFGCEGEGIVQTIFAQGTDPALVARVLRKFADMLEGPNRFGICNLGLEPDDFDECQRSEDGSVEVYNLKKESELYRKEREFGEEDDDGEDWKLA